MAAGVSDRRAALAQRVPVANGRLGGPFFSATRHSRPLTPCGGQSRTISKQSGVSPATGNRPLRLAVRAPLCKAVSQARMAWADTARYTLGMTPTLRAELQHALDESGGRPLRVEDPRTRKAYVLVEWNVANLD